jgi:hypothetical protein
MRRTGWPKRSFFRLRQTEVLKTSLPTEIQVDPNPIIHDAAVAGTQVLVEDFGPDCCADCRKDFANRVYRVIFLAAEAAVLKYIRPLQKTEPSEN